MRRSPSIVMFVLVALGFLPQPALASATVGLWHMDETSGPIATDSSGLGNDGVLTDVVFVSPGYDGTGGAYSFNGTSAKVAIPDDPSLDPGSSDISITAHVSTTVAPSLEVGDYDLIRKQAGGVLYKMEIVGPRAKALCKFKGTIASHTLKAGRGLADGAWHTITCTKTSSTVSVTIDGVTTSVSATVGSISNKAELILGGKQASATDWFLGTMDEVSIEIG